MRVLSFLAAALTLSNAVAADSIVQDAESKAVNTAMAAYAAAYNAADIPKLSACWSADCDFIDHKGRRYQGRDEVTAMFRKALVDGRGYKIELKVKSRRFLSPDLVLDDGVLELTEPSGEKESGRYATIWAKKDGAWKLHSVRDMPADAETKAAGQNPLTDLQFLVGDWEQKTDAGRVALKCFWKTPGKLLVQEFNVAGTKDAKQEFQVTVFIAWDPIIGKVRSWYFDSSGGFGDATWQKRGNGWSAVNTGVLPDGRSSSSTSEWSNAGNATLLWKATSSEIDGQAVADIEAKFNRIAKAP